MASALDRAASRLGFAAWGVAEAHESTEAPALSAWLDAGYHADMDWMDRHAEMRADPRLLFPGCRSVIMFADSYRDPEGHDGSVVARYACGNDYHRTMKDRIHEVWAELRALAPAAKGRVVADSAPLMEHYWAARSGVGWAGKHTLTITEEAGSFVTLGCLLTDLALPTSKPSVDRCGTCRACLDACPTGAIVAERLVDARRCLSYLTIEKKGPLSAEEGAALGARVFGCDACQDACPWNQTPRSHRVLKPAAYGRSMDPRVTPDPRQWLAESCAEESLFKERLGATPLTRIGRDGLKRNLEASIRPA
ncbi:MAG: tRNA epoxyqueuosine(34) reductase QueG [Spirochaetes bacterium]|nr:tRNA epoxyqueuosine(34) reductase QueG [Spirochaetota bacterium]